MHIFLHIKLNGTRVASEMEHTSLSYAASVFKLVAYVGVAAVFAMKSSISTTISGSLSFTAALPAHVLRSSAATFRWGHILQISVSCNQVRRFGVAPCLLPQMSLLNLSKLIYALYGKLWYTSALDTVRALASTTFVFPCGRTLVKSLSGFMTWSRIFFCMSMSNPSRP